MSYRVFLLDVHFKRVVQISDDVGDIIGRWQSKRLKSQL